VQEDLGKSEAALIEARRNHLASLRSRGSDPFAQTRYAVDATCEDIAKHYAVLGPEEKAQSETWHLAGRIMTKRGMGKTIFADLRDRSGRLRVRLQLVELVGRALAVEVEEGEGVAGHAADQLGGEVGRARGAAARSAADAHAVVLGARRGGDVLQGVEA